MSLFKCFNPACQRGFSTNKGLILHMQKHDICAEYVAGTVLDGSSDESDSDTDSISPEVFEENNNLW